MPTRKFMVFTTILIVATSLLVMLVFHLSSVNRQQLEEINHLRHDLDKLQNRMAENTRDLETLDALQFRDRAVRKKYPVFSKIVDVVYHKSRSYGFNPNLILGLIQVESDFRPRAVSSAGAYGLMQINFAVWKEELDIDSLRIFDIEYNVELGLTILQRYLEEARGNLLRALHLYNNGYAYNNTKYKDKVTSTVFY